MLIYREKCPKKLMEYSKVGPHQGPREIFTIQNNVTMYDVYL